MAVKCASCGNEHEDWVPAARLSEVATARREAEKQATEAAARITELEASTGRVAELESGLAALQADRDRLAMQTEIMTSGVTDPEGVQIVSTLWAALPEDARPSDVRAWLTSADVPRAVRVYLPPPPADPAAASEAPPAPAPAVPAAPPRAVPPSSAGVTPSASPPGAQTMPSAQQIAQMTPAEYARHRADLLASLGGQAGR